MIGRVTRLARKLRGRDLAELRERGEQALAAWRERTGYATGELAMDDVALARRLRPGLQTDPATLLTEFRARAPRFFPVFDDPAGTRAALDACGPADRTDVLARAGRVLGGHFDLLGYEGLSYGAPIDWQLDPVHGRRAPDAHWSRVPYLDFGAVGDHKVTWEVNRQQYLVTLGQAYWYTGDERWARTFASHVTAWLDANPPKRGINWASSLEVAFRAMSWVWALHFFRNSPALTPALYARLLNALHVHARHLERYLSTYFSPNTHLTGEALGLVHVGAFLPELRGAERWLRTGLDVLTAWLPRQVRADGGYFEQATQYHRYTTEFALHLLVLDGRHGWGLGEWLRPLVTRLARYLRAVAHPDGTIPLIGDDDGGKLVLLDARPPDDVRPVLTQLAAVLGDPTLLPSAGELRASVIWLLGAAGGRALDALPPTEPADLSQAFRDTGVFVIRDGWGPGAAHAVIDCGPHGAFNAGHAHADLLSLTANASGRPLLVDSGTYTYMGPERNEFRAADAHNVLLVDGSGSSEPAADSFQWRTATDGRMRNWVAHPEFVYFEGEHDGFARIAGVGMCRRSVLFLPDVGWVVRDRLDAAGSHEVRIHWHLAPDLTAHVPPNSGTATVRDSAAQQVLSVAAFGGGTLETETAWISPRYGTRTSTTRLYYHQQLTGSHDVVTFLAVAATAAAGAPAVREAPIHGLGRAFVVEPLGAPALVVGFDASAGWDEGAGEALAIVPFGTVLRAGDLRLVRPPRA